MQNNPTYGFQILKTIKNERSIQTLKVKLKNAKICIAKTFDQSYCIQMNEQMTFMTNLNTIFRLKYPSLLPLDGYNLRNYEMLLYPIIFTQYLPNGSLENLLNILKQRKNRFKWTQTDNYITLLGISLGLNYLHSKNIVHQNLKPSNILFDDNYRPIICDIDIFNQIPTTFTKSYDICCFAQIIYELITNESPPIQIYEIPDLKVQEFIINCISDNIEKVPSSEEVLDFILEKSFKDLFGTIDINKVIEYLNFCHENQTDGEDFAVHGMIIYENENEKENAADLFKEGAKRGSAKCAFMYASMITKEGIKTDYNKDEIIQLYEKAIENGNEIAMYNCACFIIQNFQSKEYIDKVNNYFKMAADKDHTLACYQYALVLLNLNQNKEAAQYFKKAADKENVESMFYYAKLLMKFDDQNKEDVITYYQKAIEKGDINSMNNYAKIIMNSNKDDEKKLALKYFQIAAEKGNNYAMCNLAYMYQVGQGIKQNLDEAKKFYMQSINKGNPKAMNLYGRMLELNNFDNENILNASHFYKKAAEKGNVKAMNNLISLIEKGNQIEISIDDMIHYCKTAADKGKLNSMIFYARMLYIGKNITMNKDDAKLYFLKAIEKGSIDAMLCYGNYLELENNNECINYYKMAANKGNLKAISYIIKITKKYKYAFDDKEKEFYFKLAANNGNAYAMYKYGSIKSKKNQWIEAAKYFWKAINAFQNNESLTDDSKLFYTKALNCYMDLLEKQKIEPISQFQENNTEIFKKAADSNNLYAMVQYGLRLKDGIGTEIDKDKAFDYIKKAAEEGYLSGIQNCARFLELGIGTEQNLEEAKKVYKIAIENGSIKSIFYYGLLLNNHFPESIDEALKYFKEAAEKGHNEAMYFYASKFAKNQEEKLSYFKKAADNGYIKAMYNYALFLYKENAIDKYQEIKKYFYKALVKGHVKSMRYYADVLKNDKIPNIKLIGFYYKKSADNGDKKAMYLYGKHLEKHDKIYHDLKTSIYYIKSAADLGHKKATKDIIEMILKNKYTPENKDELVFYLKKGVENHNLSAMYKYGLMLKVGDGIPKDYEKGIELIKNAADEGYVDAMSDHISDIISKNGIVNYNYEHFEEESKKYQQILLDYKSDNTRVFVDENFPPFKDWKRVDEIYPAPLFKKDLISPNYIVQGDIGDCYLISSLSRIAVQHYLVYQLFERYLPNMILGPVEESINIKSGAVVIYFHAFGHRTPVLIDTYIPIKNGVPIFSSLSDETKSPWFCLVEKAFAKLCGSYSNIVSGMASNVIYYLFFYYSKLIHNSYLTVKSSAFQKIMKYQEKGYLIEASITNNDEIDGLIGNHSYFLFKAREVQNQKFICLRNPLGISGFKGKYERNSPNWTPELKRLLGFDQCKSGTFYMTDEEFFKYFDSIIIIKPVHPEWYIKRYQCQLSPGPFDGVEIENRNADLSNHQTFAFQITEDFQIGKKCHLRIIVERSRSTFHDQISNNQARSRYCLIVCPNNGQKFDADISNVSDYQCYEGLLNIQTFSIDVTNNDIITIVLHRLDKQEYTENCYVSVICDYKFKLFDVDLPDQEIPYSENPGIVFENFTISFPNISKPLTMTYLDNRFVITFGSFTLNDSINQKEFEKLFEFANKKVGSSHLNLDDFEKVSDAIGHGSNAKIYIVEEKKTKKLYAAKIGNYKITATKGFLRELTILRSIKYPSIINFKGFIEKDFIDKQFPTIITEYLQLDSLSKMLNSEHYGILDSKELKKWNLRQRWTPTKKMINLIGIALGMDYLHRHNIIHRDLKFQNVLLDDDLYPKICDFGDSKLIEIESDKIKTQLVGTSLFMAPEISNGGNSYSFPVDVYSFGVMAYFIYSNQVPLKSKCSIVFEFLDPKYRKFISDMINPNPNERPTFNQIVNSFLTNRNETWIDGVDENEIELYLHKFGLSIKPKKQEVNFDIIKEINEEIYPENAKHPSVEIHKIIENESIPKQIRDYILASESYINTNSQENSNEKEIGNILFETAQLFYLGKKESIFNIQEDHFYAIKYFKEAALCKHEQSICLLAYIFASDSNPESHEYAFKIANFAADLGFINGFYNLGLFYNYGVGVYSNVVMSAINFKIAADRGDVESMIEYANTLMKVGEHEIDHDILKEQIKDAENIIFKDEGKKNYIYNETRLTIEALENEYVALYVSERYFQKAMNKGNKEAELKYLMIKQNNKNNNDHPQYFDDLFLSLHPESFDT